MLGLALADGSLTQALFIPAVLTLIYVAITLANRAEAQKVTTMLSRLFETEPRRH